MNTTALRHPAEESVSECFYYEPMILSTGSYHALPDGTPAYEERYAMVSRFFNGLAVVQDKKTGKEYHITTDGKPAYSAQFEFVGSFVGQKNSTEAIKKGRYILINRKGKEIYPIKEES